MTTDAARRELERDRLRTKRANPDYLANERRRNRLRMRRARASQKCAAAQIVGDQGAPGSGARP